MSLLVLILLPINTMAPQEPCCWDDLCFITLQVHLSHIRGRQSTWSIMVTRPVSQTWTVMWSPLSSCGEDARRAARHPLLSTLWAGSKVSSGPAVTRSLKSKPYYRCLNQCFVSGCPQDLDFSCWWTWFASYPCHTLSSLVTAVSPTVPLSRQSFSEQRTATRRTHLPRQPCTSSQRTTHPREVTLTSLYSRSSRE